MDSYTQLTREGKVDGWTTFNGDIEHEGSDQGDQDDQSAEYERVEYVYESQDEYEYWVPPRSYNVVDLVVGGTVVSDLKRQQCALFLSNGFYQTKAWVN